MNKTIRRLHDPAEILYLPLDLPSVYIAGYADAAFANIFLCNLGTLSPSKTSMTLRQSFITDHGSVSE